MSDKRLVYFFNEGSLGMRDILGYKGANLAEMTRLGLPVPFGFTVTTAAWENFRDKGFAFSDELLGEIDEKLAVLSEVTGLSFDDPERKLYVSVRAGNRAGNAAAKIDSVLEIGSREEMLSAISRALSSGDHIAANVQHMVFGDHGAFCGSGRACTRNPRTGEKEIRAAFYPNKVGRIERVAGDEMLPLREDAGFPPFLVQKISSVAGLLERHYSDMEEIEFVVDDGSFFMLQTRKAPRSGEAALKVATDLALEGIIDKREALLRVAPERLNVFSEREDTKLLLRWADEVRNIRVLSSDGDIIFGEDGTPVRRLVRLYWNASEFTESVAKIEAEREAAGEGEEGEPPRGAYAALIWTPLAVLHTEEIAKAADVIYFDLTSLSEAIYGISPLEASEVKGKAGKLLEGNNPFRSLNPEGAGALIHLGIERARRGRPGVKIGIYGPYGEDVRTLAFLAAEGGSYILCDKEQHPAARLAAAQALLKKE